MNFELEEEYVMFRDTVRTWVDRECPKDWCRELERQEHVYPQALWEKLSAAGDMGLLTQVQKKGRAGVGGATRAAFDVEGFHKLLLAVAGDKNFAALHNSITTLQKVGQISAQDAEKYKMQISKEQAAGTAPTINQVTNYTNHTGSTSMVMSSKVDNSEYISLTNY